VWHCKIPSGLEILALVKPAGVNLYKRDIAGGDSLKSITVVEKRESPVDPIPLPKIQT
jgi:hypothetical protein